MGKKATKAADNMYYLARCEASKANPDFASRERAAEIIGTDRTRLARIELDAISPYPEEVKAMAEHYNTPELCNTYCARECPIGRDSVPEVTIDDFDRLALKVLGSLKDIDSLRASLIAIPGDPGFAGKNKHKCQGSAALGNEKHPAEKTIESSLRRNSAVMRKGLSDSGKPFYLILLPSPRIPWSPASRKAPSSPAPPNPAEYSAEGQRQAFQRQGSPSRYPDYGTAPQ